MRRILLVLVAAAVIAGCAANGSQRRGPDGRNPAEVNVELGVRYMQAGMKAVALEKLKKALDQDPELPSAHNAIAVLYQNLGEDGLAEEHFRRALRLDPKYSQAHNNFGIFLCRKDRWAEAEQHFVAAGSDPLYERPELPYTNAGVCAAKAGDPVKAEHYLQLALKANPLFPIALREMARLTLDKGEYLRTRAYLQRYSEVARHTAETLWIGIQAERALGDRDAVASSSLLLRNNFPESEQARRLNRPGAND